MKNRRQCNGDDDLIDTKDVASTLTLPSNSAATLPYAWLYENRDLGIICAKDDTEFPLLLVSGLLKLFKLQIENNTDKDIQATKIVLASSKDNPTVHITCDVAAFTCHKVTRFTPLQYLISFNSPLLIHNYLPHPLAVSYRYLGKEKQLGTANSQDVLEPYEIEGENFNESKLKWTVYARETQHYVCGEWRGNLQPNAASEHQLSFELVQKTKAGKEQQLLTLKASVRPDSNLVNKYANFLLRDKVYENCCRRKIVVYSKHAIVNKTGLPIKFTADTESSITLPAHSSCLFDLGENKSLRFKTKGSGKFGKQGVEWSKAMQVNTLGVAGAFSLELKKKSSKDALSVTFSQR